MRGIAGPKPTHQIVDQLSAQLSSKFLGACHRAEDGSERARILFSDEPLLPLLPANVLRGTFDAHQGGKKASERAICRVEGIEISVGPKPLAVGHCSIEEHTTGTLSRSQLVYETAGIG